MCCLVAYGKHSIGMNLCTTGPGEQEAVPVKLEDHGEGESVVPERFVSGQEGKERFSGHAAVPTLPALSMLLKGHPCSSCSLSCCMPWLLACVLSAGKAVGLTANAEDSHGVHRGCLCQMWLVRADQRPQQPLHKLCLQLPSICSMAHGTSATVDAAWRTCGQQLCWREPCSVSFSKVGAPRRPPHSYRLASRRPQLPRAAGGGTAAVWQGCSHVVSQCQADHD